MSLLGILWSEIMSLGVEMKMFNFFLKKPVLWLIALDIRVEWNPQPRIVTSAKCQVSSLREPLARKH